MSKLFNEHLIEMYAEIDLGVNDRWSPYKYNTEEYWKWMEKEYNSAERDFREFVRDHRSRDDYGISIHKKYEYVCKFCGHEWGEEEPKGILDCCDEMLEAQNIQEIVIK